ncbi:hypothetical protein HNS38_04425 [Lentimicrobium sp. L6]|uniref:hypothetical protein n=1 Tax=Lentimicrobium sp. L6 TaxID=2735916 RepID=UPI001554B44E|nr:hypothetical protein [Lentimicrobium sp. L6]NPD83990.1 hypothetical protein [Lentimicrobium sp. L6]
MKTLLITFIILPIFACICFGQNQIPLDKSDSTSIEVYVNKEGKVFLNKEKTNLKKLESFLADSEIKKAKFATVFPTPIEIFAIVEKISLLFKKNEIKYDWYSDPEFTNPAWD